MIYNPEKLLGCLKNTLIIVDYAESFYKDITINSGFRSEKYNKSIGGAKGSAHVKGMAVDLSAKNVSAIKIAGLLLSQAKSLGIKGIGIDVYQNYVHVDTMDRGSRGITYWSYGRNGKVS